MLRKWSVFLNKSKETMLTIYHNPRCRKSRETLALIEESATPVTIVEYLKEAPTAQELAGLLEKLGMEAKDLLRKGEAIFKEQFKGREHTNEEWIEIMVTHPKLIERPIVVKGDQAVIGRPPENVKELL